MPTAAAPSASSSSPTTYFRRQGYVTSQTSSPDHPADRRGQHHLGCRLSAPRLHLAELDRDARQEPRGDLAEHAPQDHQRKSEPALTTSTDRISPQRHGEHRETEPCLLCDLCVSVVIIHIFRFRSQWSGRSCAGLR
jgi:hypothetical protein